MESVSDYFPIWHQLTQAQQDALTKSAARRTVRKGTVISSGLSECTGLLLIESGQLRIYSLSADGRELTLYRLFERDMCLFSASCMMRSIQFDMTVMAEKDTALLLIPAEDYKRVMEQSAVLANYTNEVMASRFSDVMWLIDQIMWKSFDKRLAAFLLEESALESSAALKITHETIGNHMGSPREVVTRMLRYFQGEGMVKLSRGTIEIADRGKLEALRSAQ